MLLICIGIAAFLLGCAAMTAVFLLDEGQPTEHDSY
jgi:hypothetical protein